MRDTPSVVVTGKPAASDDLIVLVSGSGTPNLFDVFDVFEVVERDDAIIVARSPFLFEVGEELTIRIDSNGSSREATVRVRRHRDDGATELELL